MYVLSVRQPWAALIMAGLKDIENRTWTTRHRGLLGIHASQTRLPLADQARIRHVLTRNGPRRTRRRIALVLDGELVYGALLGTVQLIDVCHSDTCQCSPWHEEDAYGWKLRKPTTFPRPRPMPGRLGLWTLPS